VAVACWVVMFISYLSLNCISPAHDRPAKKQRLIESGK